MNYRANPIKILETNLNALWPWEDDWEEEDDNEGDDL